MHQSNIAPAANKTPIAHPQALLIALIDKIKTRKPGQELACNSFTLLGYEVGYAAWLSAVDQLRAAQVLETRRVPNGYGGWDYVEYVAHPEKTSQIQLEIAP